MKTFEYTSLPGSQTQVQNFFRGRKLVTILVAVFSITAITLFVTVSYNGSTNVISDTNNVAQASNLQSIEENPQLLQRSWSWPWERKTTRRPRIWERWALRRKTKVPSTTTTTTALPTSRVTTEDSKNVKTKSPRNSRTKNPANAVTEIPVKVATDSQVEVKTEAPVIKTVTDSPANVVTENVKIITNSPVKDKTDSGAKVVPPIPDNISNAPVKTATTKAPVIPEATDSGVKVVTHSPVKVATDSSVQVATDSSVKVVTDSPVKVATDSLVGIATNSPAKVATDSPVRRGTDSPAKVATDSPVRIATDSPAKVATDSPVRRGTDSPAKVATASAVKIATDVPIKATIDPLVKIVTNPSVKVATDSPVNVVTNSPVKVANGSSLNVVTGSSVNVVTNRFVKVATDSPGKVASNLPVKVATNSPANVATDASVKKITDIPAEIKTEAPEKPLPEIPAKAVTEVQTNSDTKAPVNARNTIETDAPVAPMNGSISTNETNVPYNFVQRSPQLIVRTAEGCIEGTTLESRAGRNYFAYYNVPYAAPPVGQLRFKSPEPPQTWTGVRDGTKMGAQCIQTEKYAPVLRSAGEEDCLYLNVFTPKLPTSVSTNPCTEDSTEVKVNPNLPVMVYIHGGGFNSGNGSRYGPDYFMDEDVIIITFEFRLGAFGFMSTGDMEIRGNMGFKDSIMALRWVQRNIAAFGGDPKKVTIFGNSSGSIHVHALLLSNMSKGLFHAAISQSGTAIAQGGGVNPYTTLPIVVNIAIEFGCNASNTTTKAIVDCLRKVDAKDLATVQSPLAFFLPNVEPIPEDGNLSDVFYHKRPYEIMTDSENYPMKVPWIIGDTSGEELGAALQILKNPDQVRNLNENWTDTITNVIPFKHKPSDVKLESLKEFYFGHYIKRAIDNHTRFELMNLLTDHKWTHATTLSALAHAKHSPVFLYILTKESAKSYADAHKPGFSPPFAVAHADELQYLFLYDGYPEIPIGSTYARFSQKLVKNWATFAANGCPDLVDWTPIDPANNGTVYYRLDDDDKTGMTKMLRRRVNFWQDFTYEMFE